MTTPQNPFEPNNNDAQGNANPYGGAPQSGDNTFGANNTYGSDSSGATGNPYESAGAFPGGTGYDAGYAAGAPGEKPNNDMVWSIINTILSLCNCCIPFGLIGLFFSTQVNKKWDMGDFAGAQDSAAKARKTNIVVSVLIAIAFVASLIANLTGAVDYSQFMNGNV